MMDASIRIAEPRDADALSALGWATFLETFVDGFALPYPAADLDAFFMASYATERMGERLGDPMQRVWIAERGDTPVGFATAGPCALPHPEAKPGDGELKRLYVLAGEKGTGLAARLMDEALAWMTRTRPGPVWLGVWSGNLRAQRFYARYGFEKAGEYDYAVGATRDHEFILRRP